MSEAIIPIIPEEQYFFVHDGKVIRSIEEMPDILSAMSDDTFRHHVNESKNDFVSWIQVVFVDSDLADRMGKTRDRNETIRIIREYIRELYGPSVQEVVRKPANAEPASGIEGRRKDFENRYQEQWKKVSDIRKKGYDTKLAELMLMRIPARIRIFAATEREEDAKTVESLLDDLRIEIDELLKEQPIKVIEPENRQT